MADDDFDLQRLATYLHLTPVQVTRLADRGKLPGRKVQGQWRFAQAEIHHWLENRIGLSGEEELEQMEAILRPVAGNRFSPRDIAAMLPLAAIEVPLLAKTRNSVITSMAKVAAQTGLLWDPQKMADAVRDREDMHPTALEIGVALMHPRRPMTSILGEAFIAFGRTEKAIPFGGRSGILTDLFFLICSTDDRGHLQTLARLSRIIAEPELLSALRSAPDAQAVHDAIRASEAKIGVPEQK
jgi:nitrogen PTS system EIIA component